MLAMSATVLAIVALAPEMPRNATDRLVITREEILELKNPSMGGSLPPKVVKLEPLDPMRGPTGGPMIALMKPSDQAEVPNDRVEVTLVFTETGAKIDIKSLAIYVYWLFKYRDITDRVLNLSGVKVSESGLTTPPFEVPDIGQMSFRVALSDVNGKKSERDFKVTLVEPE